MSSSVPNIRGAHVLLTGAAGALGTATARRLAAAGARITLTDRDEAGLARVADLVGGIGAPAAQVPCDVLDDEQLGGLVDQAQARLGPLDVVISNAGVEFNAQFHTADADALDRQLGIHLRAPMRLIHDALPGMLERGRGHVVVVSSLNGKVPFPAKVPYAAAKAGSIAMVHALRRDYRDSPVGFSVVLPALVTGGGQADRAMEQSGVQPPRLLPTTTVERCAQAIESAIRQGRAEVVVSSSPNAPIAGLQWSFPAAADRLLELTGIPDFWRDVARGASA